MTSRSPSRKRQSDSAGASRASPVAHTPQPKKAKGCVECSAWERHAKRLEADLAEREATLNEREEELTKLSLDLDMKEATLVKREEKLALLEARLKARKVELDKRIEEVERQSELVTPPIAVRQETRRKKVEQRMQLAVTLNKLPRESSADGSEVESVKGALARMGKSYQDLNEGNGFLVAGSLYGNIERFLQLFDPKENLTRITPVARLLDVIKNVKWKATAAAAEAIDPPEDRAKTFLHTFRVRVQDVKVMSKVLKWLNSRESQSLHGISEDELTDLLYHTLPDSEEDSGENSAAAIAAQFKPPPALRDLPDKIELRNEQLKAKMTLADKYDEALDKDLFYAQHGKYNVMIGVALRKVAEAYVVRTGGLGRLAGANFFFNLFPAGQSGKRKRATLGIVEEASLLISTLDDVKEFARLVDMPNQMEDVCAIASEAVDLHTASVKDPDAVKKLLALMKKLEKSKRRDAVIQFVKKYATKEVPRYRDPRECVALLEKHLGDPVMNALFELSRIDLQEEPNQAALEKALSEWGEFVDELHNSDHQITPDERDACIIAAMLFWKRAKEINKSESAHDTMVSASLLLAGIFRQKRGKKSLVYDQDTGEEGDLFNWPQ